jgi:hypothetical protein
MFSQLAISLEFIYLFWVCMGGRNIFPQNHMWAQHCLVRDSSQLVFPQQRVVGRMRGGTAAASSASAQLVLGLLGGISY